MNPIFDNAVKRGETNFVYNIRQGFENGGAEARLSTNDGFGYAFSKNTEPPIYSVDSPFLIHNLPNLTSPIYTFDFGSNFVKRKINPVDATFEDIALISLLNMFPLPGKGDFVKFTGHEIPKEAVDNAILPYVERSNKLMESGWYARRLKENGLLENRDEILRKYNDNLNHKTTYVSIPLPENIKGQFMVEYPWNNFTFYLSSLKGNKPIESTVLHELGGHRGETGNPLLYEHNKQLAKEGYNHLNVPYEKLNQEQKDKIDYLLKTNDVGQMTELRGLLWPTLVEMYEKGYTVDDILNGVYFNEELDVLMRLFDEDYIRLLLSPKGIVLNTNSNSPNEYYYG